MKNLKLTTKPEILSYLENQKVSLQKKTKLYANLFLSGSVLGGCTTALGSHMLGIDLDRVLHPTEAFQANVPLGILCFSLSVGILIENASLLEKYFDSKDEIQETEQKIDWVKDETFVENAMLQLEEKIVELREEKMQKIKSR